MFKSLYDVLKQRDLLQPAVHEAEEALELARRLTYAVTGELLHGTPTEIDVYETDKRINAAEIEVRRMVFEHLATSNAPHHVTATILLLTITDVERIGDQAKNIHQLKDRLKGSWPTGVHFDAIVELRDELMLIFDGTCTALKEDDAERASRAMSRSAEFGRRCESIVDDLCNSDSPRVCEVVVGALAARFMKRMGAHLSNLASSVVNPVDRIGYRPADPSVKGAE